MFSNALIYLKCTYVIIYFTCILFDDSVPISKAPLGKSCEKDEDCEYIENSICSVNKICVCDVNYYALNKYTCVASLNAHCLKDEECHMDFSFCSNNICKCKPNTAAISSNQCMMSEYHFLIYIK